MEEVLLTTFDNPWSPFDEFDQWKTFDSLNNYRTMELLAREVDMIENKDDFDEEDVRNIVVEDIARRNPFGIHMKINREEAKKLIEKRNKTE